jgi:hypothetical protein
VPLPAGAPLERLHDHAVDGVGDLAFPLLVAGVPKIMEVQALDPDLGARLPP